MKLFLSKLYAEFMSHYYGGDIHYHHINQDGWWEFYLKLYDTVTYRTPGLKNVSL